MHQSQLTQQFQFFITLQSIEVSQTYNTDINQCKLVAQIKKGASQQQLLQVQLNSMNVQQISGYYRIDIQHKFEINQKLVEREKGAGFGDYQVKLLFYLQSLKTKHQLGQITINLAYYPNANIKHLQEKKYMQGTTDKRAALFFELNLVDNSDIDNEFSNQSQGGSDIVMHEVNNHRNQSIESEIQSRIKIATQENYESSSKKPITQKIQRNNKLTSSQTARQFQEELQQDLKQEIRTKSRAGQPSRLKSPSQMIRGASKSIDRMPFSSGLTKKIEDDSMRLKSPSSKKGLIKPRAKSPTPQPMPNKLPYPTVEQNENPISTDFNNQHQHQEQLQLIQKEEEDIYDQLNLIDRRIEKTNIRAEPMLRSDSSFHQNELNCSTDRSPLELEMQKTINQLREEVEKLRDQLQAQQRPQSSTNNNSQDIERFKNIIKELSSKMNIKNQEVEKSKQQNEKLNEENQKLREEVLLISQEKQNNKDIIEKLRAEVDESSNIYRKLMIDNNNLNQRIDELTKLKTQSSFSSLTNTKDLQMEITLLKQQLSEQQQKNRLLTLQNDQLQKSNELNKDLQNSSISTLEFESQMKVFRQDLESSVAECNRLKALLQTQTNQCQNQLETIKMYQLEMNKQDQTMTNMEGEMVKIKQQMAEYLNAAFEMGGADLVDLIEQKVNAMDN